jgi:hypothetical protein
MKTHMPIINLNSKKMLLEAGSNSWMSIPKRNKKYVPIADLYLETLTANLALSSWRSIRLYGDSKNIHVISSRMFTLMLILP